MRLTGQNLRNASRRIHRITKTAATDAETSLLARIDVENEQDLEVKKAPRWFGMKLPGQPFSDKVLQLCAEKKLAVPEDKGSNCFVLGKSSLRNLQQPEYNKINISTGIRVLFCATSVFQCPNA